jgi:hypothetical protein
MNNNKELTLRREQHPERIWHEVVPPSVRAKLITWLEEDARTSTFAELPITILIEIFIFLCGHSYNSLRDVMALSHTSHRLYEVSKSSLIWNNIDFGYSVPHSDKGMMYMSSGAALLSDRLKFSTSFACGDAVSRFLHPPMLLTMANNLRSLYLRVDKKFDINNLRHIKQLRCLVDLKLRTPITTLFDVPSFELPQSLKSLTMDRAFVSKVFVNINDEMISNLEFLSCDFDAIPLPLWRLTHLKCFSGDGYAIEIFRLFLVAPQLERMTFTLCALDLHCKNVHLLVTPPLKQLTLCNGVPDCLHLDTFHNTLDTLDVGDCYLTSVELNQIAKCDALRSLTLKYDVDVITIKCPAFIDFCANKAPLETLELFASPYDVLETTLQNALAIKTLLESRCCGMLRKLVLPIWPLAIKGVPFNADRFCSTLTSLTVFGCSRFGSHDVFDGSFFADIVPQCMQLTSLTINTDYKAVDQALCMGIHGSEHKLAWPHLRHFELQLEEAQMQCLYHLIAHTTLLEDVEDITLNRYSPIIDTTLNGSLTRVGRRLSTYKRFLDDIDVLFEKCPKVKTLNGNYNGIENKIPLHIKFTWTPTVAFGEYVTDIFSTHKTIF